MKRFVTIVICIFLLGSLFGCKSKEDGLGKQTTIDEQNGYSITQEVLPFKFSKVEDTFKNNPKVKLDGFVTDETKATGHIQTKTNALEIAKKEITEKYNQVNFGYDRTRGVWKVVFSNNIETPTQEKETSVTQKNNPLATVYVDEDGYTLAVVSEK